MLNTAFIGLGSQGGPMAERMLAAGFPLTVWGRRREALQPFAEKGAVLAENVAALGAAADHVGICVVDDAGVAEVCNALVPSMRPGSLLAVHSTILPESCEALAAICEARRIAFVDAPVSGGGGAATAGTLTVMCGGSAAAFEQARPIFKAFAGTLVHLGGAGAGQRAKIVNNALMAANMGNAHAAIEAGRALGMAPEALKDLIKASSGRSFGFEVYARLPEPKAFSHGAALLRKDVDLLRAILPDGSDTRTLGEAADHFLEEAVAP
ncbi:3-hydroxyisobutyrate dehydrogenase-like beta-hydroxyacid dehydrogenase [Novosphingobium sp. PhB165]|uniref:NAD(P)-dependent oxidoreductase n=1 Tax=Novosphingobium sp. PhB165 TaxID=2485105 RepID=UPI0010463ACB|nr:NAD(P)-dependent oxidoreductase [Novosphingobium sp. PhB165]TCM14606.1 3-hydroxyisobutyrate dehydrogenase-like beta-hydroxyacid dehydrogenase [Novosphingobium sp. PhB165]